MPRARFSKAVSLPQDQPGRPSTHEALWFDIKAAETSENDSLAEWRINGSDHSALLLGAAHLLLGGACLARYPQLAVLLSLSNPILAIAALLLLDVIAALALRWRDRLELVPHTVARAMCVYLAATGVLWTVFGLDLTANSAIAPNAAVPVWMCAGFAMAAVVAISSPPLSVVN